MTQQELEAAKLAAYRAPKGFRVPALIGPDGQRWKWISSRRYWAAVSLPETTSTPMFRNSVTMCRNRNLRRKAMGYSDFNYSIRDRGWPYALRNGKPQP